MLCVYRNSSFSRRETKNGIKDLGGGTIKFLIDTDTLFSKTVILLYNPTNAVWEYSFPSLLPTGFNPYKNIFQALYFKNAYLKNNKKAHFVLCFSDCSGLHNFFHVC